MKSKIFRILTTIGILSLLPIFMGQEECEISETYMKLIKQINYKLSPPPGQGKTYITHLSFLDARTQSTMASTEYAELINKVVEKGMAEAAKQNPQLALNETGHIIKNTDENVNKLINIVFDPNLTKNQKIDKIIAEIMNPNHVDVIVTGYYIDDINDPFISVGLIVIVKHTKRIVAKNFQFTKDEIICRDPISKKATLCDDAYDQIGQAFLELLELL